MGLDELFINMARKLSIRKSGLVPYVLSDINTPKEYIEDVVIRTHENIHSLSMKLMYNQLYFHDGLLEYIKDKNMPIIHVMRRNIIKQVVSFLKMAEYNHNPIDVTINEFVTLLEDAYHEPYFMISEFRDQIKLTLYYEDMIGKTIDDKTYLSEETNEAVCNFFNVKNVKLFAKTKKKNKEDISIYIPHLIEDLKIKFKGTKFENILKESLDG